MAPRSVSAELAAESKEIRDIKTEEKHLLNAFNTAKINPEIKWLAARIRIVLDKEEELHDLLKTELRLTNRIRQLNKLAKKLTKKSKTVQVKEITAESATLTTQLTVLNKEKKEIEYEILRREKKIMDETKLSKNAYSVYKEILTAGKITARDLAKFG